MHPIFDATRATAALMVLVGHALGIFNARHPVWPQQFGVVIFFLLSGYLISQTLHKRLEQPQSTFLEYAVDRWRVFIPDFSRPSSSWLCSTI